MPGAPILSHNWTGALALYATSPAQPLLANNSVKGVTTSSKSAGKGTWIKAASHARLRLHEGEDNYVGLELHLQDHLLLKCQLCGQQLSLQLLPSSNTCSSNILVLTAKQQPSSAAPVCYCFRFYDASDCSSFRSALQALISNRHRRIQEQQQQQRQQQQQPQAAVGGAAQETTSQSQQETAAAAAAAAGTGAAVDGQLGGSAAAGVPGDGEAAAAAVGGQAGVAAAASAAEIKSIIKQYLLDPSFQSYVDQVDAMWDEVEQEVMGE